MEAIEDRIEIEVPPREVFTWFIHFAENYTKWHPDHVKLEWKKGNPLEIGSIALSQEYLHGKLHTLQFQVTRIEPNAYIEYSNLFPFSLLSPKGWFKFEETKSGCWFIAGMKFRWSRILKRIASDQLKQLRKHMEEEGVNLKRLLEK